MPFLSIERKAVPQCEKYILSYDIGKYMCNHALETGMRYHHADLVWQRLWKSPNSFPEEKQQLQSPNCPLNTTSQRTYQCMENSSHFVQYMSTQSLLEVNNYSTYMYVRSVHVQTATLAAGTPTLTEPSTNECHISTIGVY